MYSDMYIAVHALVLLGPGDEIVGAGDEIVEPGDEIVGAGDEIVGQRCTSYW